MSRPLAYVDTSALIKRFVSELRSADMEAFLMQESHRCVLSSLSLTELKTVMQRKLRIGDISLAANQHANQLVTLELAQGIWQYQSIDDALFTYTGELVEQLESPLGTLDALHLACAKTARCDLMVSGDKQLLRASAEVGLQILDLS